MCHPVGTPARTDGRCRLVWSRAASSLLGRGQARTSRQRPSCIRRPDSGGAKAPAEQGSGAGSGALEARGDTRAIGEGSNGWPQVAAGMGFENQVRLPSRPTATRETRGRRSGAGSRVEGRRAVAVARKCRGTTGVTTAGFRSGASARSRDRSRHARPGRNGAAAPKTRRGGAVSRVCRSPETLGGLGRAEARTSPEVRRKDVEPEGRSTAGAGPQGDTQASSPVRGSCPPGHGRAAEIGARPATGKLARPIGLPTHGGLGSDRTPRRAEGRGRAVERQVRGRT